MFIQLINKIYNALFYRSNSNGSRTISLFVVQDTTKKFNGVGAIRSAPVTVTSTYAEAVHAIDRLMYLNSIAHYSSWADVHNYPHGFGTDSWREYRTTVLPGISGISSRYIATKVDYKASDIASLFRIFSVQMPLFLPYETTSELSEYYKHNYDSATGKVSLPALLYDAAPYDEQLHTLLTSTMTQALAKLQSFKKPE